MTTAASRLAAMLAAAVLALPMTVRAAEGDMALRIVEAADTTLEEHAWAARPLVVFADNPRDPRFVQQMEYISEDPGPLAARDVVVIVDTDPSANTDIRRELRPRGFDLVLFGKDGQKYLRKPFPWDVREISRSIDKMPVRQQEMRDESLRRPEAAQ